MHDVSAQGIDKRMMYIINITRLDFHVTQTAEGDRQR